jgi:DNA-binding response OmpR family regulator
LDGTNVALRIAVYRLLLVDDEENVLVGMGRYFRLAGLQVDCARNREEAEALLSRTSYDAAIVDLCLEAGGGPEGLDVIGRLHSTSPGTRILVLTAYGSAETEAQARSLGADLLLNKPRPLREIHRELRRLLGAD